MKRQNNLLNCRSVPVFYPRLSPVNFLGSITPHILQFIKTAIFRQHHVDHYIHIIYQNPLIGLSAFVFIGEFITILPYFLFHRIGYGLHLGGAACLANDKEIRYSLGDLS